MRLEFSLRLVIDVSRSQRRTVKKSTTVVLELHFVCLVEQVRELEDLMKTLQVCHKCLIG